LSDSGAQLGRIVPATVVASPGAEALSSGVKQNRSFSSSRSRIFVDVDDGESEDSDKSLSRVMARLLM
jgi:hypothetical protein